MVVRFLHHMAKYIVEMRLFLPLGASFLGGVDSAFSRQFIMFAIWTTFFFCLYGAVRYCMQSDDYMITLRGLVLSVIQTKYRLIVLNGGELNGGVVR